MDNTDILSVGIDIGTSTTQVIFSRLKMQNTAGYFAVPHISIVDKEVIYKSDIYLTPLENEYLINADKVSEIVESEFNKAGFTPKDTNTGAVIITGESARKENAAAVLEKLSRFAGDFVVSTAGPDLESVIAGKGSGAQKYSEDNSCVVANLDIGGGTTNVVVFDCGKTVGKACVDIGGRQIKLKSDFTVDYISPSALLIAKTLGIDISVGKKTDSQSLQGICRSMVKLLEQLLGLDEKTALLDEIKTNGSSELKLKKKIRAVCFSGGVADCIYKTEHEQLKYGDIGVFLGNAIREGNIFSKFKIIDAAETIRATVVGAGTYTTTVSGSTISYSENILPLKNIPVLKLNLNEQKSVFQNDSAFLTEKIKWFAEQNDAEQLVLAMEGSKNPSYNEIQLAAECICNSLGRYIKDDKPLLILVENDMAKALGQAIRRKISNNRSVIAIDSVSVDDNDYIDLGKPLMNGLVIPVVVKTLIFG
jgi:ethanolamine utilization protein EutA